MELYKYIAGLGFACVIGFLGCIVELFALRHRVAQLEANQAAMVEVLRKQVTNTTSLAGSVDQITKMRNHWLRVVKS